ncbi:hypothetical protein ACLOJK_019196, partial [Asimina triloba]
SDGRIGDPVRHQRDHGWNGVAAQVVKSNLSSDGHRWQLQGGSHGCNDGARLGKKMMFCSGALAEWQCTKACTHVANV